MDNKIRRALISVTDKTGIADFAKSLYDFEVEIFSTGGTAKALRERCIPVTEVSDYTGFEEIMDGRVKTLHPKIFGGILAVRSDAKHMREADGYNIDMIDLVVVNLYRFEDAVARKNCAMEEAIENIDIGGPSLIRAAAKNNKFVTVVTEPDDYDMIITEMGQNNGCVTDRTRLILAAKAFDKTRYYDYAIAIYFRGQIRRIK